MKKYNFKSTIAALICACSLAFQANAATSYDIGRVGSIQITSIASSTASSATVYNNGTVGAAGAVNPTGAGNSTPVAAIFNFVGTITGSVQNGDTVKIPISVLAGSHFPYLNLSFPQNVTTINGGTTIFKSGSLSVPVATSTGTSTDTLILIAQTSMNGSGGNPITFNLQGTGSLATTGGSVAQLQGGSTTYVLDNSSALSYVINNTTITLNPSTTCNSQVGNTPYSTSSQLVLVYNLYCVYNTLAANLNETPAELAAAYPSLNSDYIEVATIQANSAILSVTAANNAQTIPVMNYVIPGSPNVVSNNGNITSFTGQTFSQVSNITDTTMASLETTMKAGQYAIVKYPDGSYAVIVDWGAFLNNAFTQYPSDADISADGDPNAQDVMAAAMADNLSALQNKFVFAVSYANPNIPNSVPVSVVRSNLPDLVPGVNSTTLTTTQVSSSGGNATTITVNYVNLNGGAINAISYTTGAPGTTTIVDAPPATIAVTATNGTVANYTLVTDAATADTVHVVSNGSRQLITAAGQVLTGSGQSATYPPTSSVNNLNVYYVYAPPKGLPITGLQLSAQVQENNDVILTWGTLTEINSKTFTVQRSSDGGKTWVTINTQPTQAANGNSSVPLTYQLTDPTVPIGSYEYRVVETDVDGSTTTSNVVQISITGGKQVYPNPASTLLNVKLPAGASSVPYRLISADGKIVLKGTITNAGNYGQISVAGIASDIYFLQITVNNTVQTYEVRIQH